MARPQSIPKLSQHKASGKAVVRLNDRDHYLGVFGTLEEQPPLEIAYDDSPWADSRHSGGYPVRLPVVVP
jgi:hypothetical protein